MRNVIGQWCLVYFLVNFGSKRNRGNGWKRLHSRSSKNKMTMHAPRQWHQLTATKIYKHPQPETPPQMASPPPIFHQNDRVLACYSHDGLWYEGHIFQHRLEGNNFVKFNLMATTMELKSQVVHGAWDGVFLLNYSVYSYFVISLFIYNLY